MIGFRGHLSTQDVMLQLSEEVLHPRHAKRTRAILALDLTKAFDNVEHTAVLNALSDLHVGGRTHAYVTAFLQAMTAVLTVGELTTDKVQLGSRGTPQGSVLSPLLFNLTLIPMARDLANISNLSHSLYADDITLWTTTGSIGDMEATLQAGADVVVERAMAIGLACSTTKSELLVLHPPKSRTDPTPNPSIRIHMKTYSIPEVTQLRVPGMVMQNNGRHTPPSEWQLTDVEGWDTAVSSSNPADQIRLVDWALRVAEGHKLPDTLRAPEPPHK
ncbi:uncharacterized protein LOC142591581 [Dermacentor variabilis]|uniref:uncharacterized protein LOC142591581 n=1 Tax=Dermacentor variabilis TaxID=34621 RepID=UPI003F5B6A62